MISFTTVFFAAFVTLYIASATPGFELIKPMVSMYGLATICMAIVLGTITLQLFKKIKGDYIQPRIGEQEPAGEATPEAQTGANSSLKGNILRCVIELPKKKIVEDSKYPVRYLFENLSEVDFPGGLFFCHLKRAVLGDHHSVKNEWRNIGPIPAGGNKSLSPKDIDAISGPNIFVFIKFEPQDLVNAFIMVGADGKELKSGDYMGYLRVRSIEEISSMNNLRIASYSLIILIGAQIFDWFFNLWINSNINYENLQFSGIVIFTILGLVLYLIHARLN